MRVSLQTALSAALLVSIGAAHAVPTPTNLVVNGGFESTSFTGQGSGPNTEVDGANNNANYVTSWTSSPGANSTGYNILFTSLNGSANSRFGGDQKLRSTVTNSPNGGNFFALDGDSQYSGPLSQLITGLTTGDKYLLTFQWAATQLTNRTGATTEELQVSLGSQTQYTNVLSESSDGTDFSGWFTASFVFVGNAGSSVLSFLSIGTPNGLPPIALLDGVSLVDIPEPAAALVLGTGLVAIGGILRRRA